MIASDTVEPSTENSGAAAAAGIPEDADADAPPPPPSGLELPRASVAGEPDELGDPPPPDVMLETNLTAGTPTRGIATRITPCCTVSAGLASTD